MELIPRVCNMLLIPRQFMHRRCLHVSAIVNRVCSGRYKITVKQNKALTYEMANPPHQIAHRKTWNVWNTSNMLNGNRPAETIVEDVFIQRFMKGTWHALFLSEIMIKRQHNMIRVGGLLSRYMKPTKVYFLTGYTEAMLSYWLQCPVKLELVTVKNAKDAIFKYV